MKQQAVILAQLGPSKIVFDPQWEITQTKAIAGISWKELEERVLKGDLPFLAAIQQGPQIFKESEFAQWWSQLLEQQKGRLLLKVYYLQNQQKIDEPTAQAICNLVGTDWPTIKNQTKKELKKYVQDLPQVELIDLATILWKRYVDWKIEFNDQPKTYKIINRMGLSENFEQVFPNKMKQVFEKIKELRLIPVIIFLQGAHNYGLADEKSDFDFKALCINEEPWKEEVKPMTISYNQEGELLDIKDWKRWQEIFATMNFSYLELLGSCGFWINEHFKEFVGNLEFTLKGDIFLKVFLIGNSIINQMQAKLKALDHPFPSKIDVLAKYGYDPKQLHHFLRLHWTLNAFWDNPFLQPRNLWLRWTPQEKKYLMQLKRQGKVIDLKKTKAQMQKILNEHIEEWRSFIPVGWNAKNFKKQLMTEVIEGLDYWTGPTWKTGLKNQFQMQMKNRDKNQERRQ